MKGRSEEARWNRLSDGMSAVHNHFKREFNTLYELADGSFTRRGMSLQAYLRLAMQLAEGLTGHHMFEERYFFPILAKRMAAFQDNDLHLKSHQAIHHGIDELTKLVRAWADEPSTYNSQEMRQCLGSWKEVLFSHLDQEVIDVSGESLKKYWTLEEVDKILPN